MKKILSVLAFAGLALTGCVENNSSVIINGIVAEEECSPSGGDQKMFAFDICDPGAYPVVSVPLHLNNYLTGESPWSSSGSGSGTTFEPDIINPAMVFIESYTIKCDRADGDTAACEGTEPIVFYKGTAFQGNGSGLCSSIMLDVATVASWGTNVIIDISAQYTDGGLIKGETNHLKFNLTFQSNNRPCFYVEKEDDSE
jgi:hypothetical protein